MYNQTISPGDFPLIATLFFLESILSIDNAVIIALITRPLSYEQKRKARFIGILSSSILRALLILLGTYLLQSIWIQATGAIYLLYLSIEYFGKSRRKEEGKRSFWVTIILVELSDLLFALDSILAGLALIGTHSIDRSSFPPPKIWIVYIGGILGLILVRSTNQVIHRLIERFPRLEMGAHLMVGWTGLKLLVEVGMRAWLNSPTHSPLALPFWIGIIGCFAFGFSSTRRRS